MIVVAVLVAVFVVWCRCTCVLFWLPYVVVLFVISVVGYYLVMLFGVVILLFGVVICCSMLAVLFVVACAVICCRCYLSVVCYNCSCVVCSGMFSGCVFVVVAVLFAFVVYM